MENTIEIINDVFDIACCIRTLGSYKVVYNFDRALFEVRSLADNSLCVTLYDKLDCRSVRKVYATMRHNADLLFAQIEQHNAQLDKQASEQAQHKYQHTMENIRRMVQ